MKKLIIIAAFIASTGAIAADKIGTTKAWAESDITLEGYSFYGRTVNVTFLIKNNGERTESISSIFLFGNALDQDGETGEKDFHNIKCDGDVPSHAVFKCRLSYNFPAPPNEVKVTAGLSHKVTFSLSSANGNNALVNSNDMALQTVRAVNPCGEGSDELTNHEMPRAKARIQPVRIEISN